MVDHSSSSYFAIVPAAGIGSRMNLAKPKQYLLLKDKTLLEHVLQTLLNCQLLKKIVIVLHPQDNYWQAISLFQHPKIITTIGGVERCHSVYQGLLALANEVKTDDWIMVHDAARPYLQLSDIEKLVAAVRNHPVGGLLGTPVRDTLKRVSVDHHVQQTIRRTQLWHALTPQLFRSSILNSALKQALATDQQSLTDEAAAVELLGMQPLMVQGRSDNIKITFPEDLCDE